MCLPVDDGNGDPGLLQNQKGGSRPGTALSMSMNGSDGRAYSPWLVVELAASPTLSAAELTLSAALVIAASFLDWLLC
jgi:hypothetical protein